MIRLKLNFVRRERERKSPNTNEFTPKKRRGEGGEAPLNCPPPTFYAAPYGKPGRAHEKDFFPFSNLGPPPHGLFP